MAMSGRFNADSGNGFRGGAGSSGSASTAQRGSFGSEQNPNGEPGQQVLSSALPGNPHSSRGFRRQLERTTRSSGRLKDQLPDKVSFGGKGYRKPNYFAQGGRRHGMHISTGAPHTTGGQQEGSDSGGAGF